MTSTREANGKLFRVSGRRRRAGVDRAVLGLRVAPEGGLAPKRVTSVRDDKCAYRPSGGDRLTSGAVLSLLQAFRNRRHGLQRDGIGLL